MATPDSASKTTTAHTKSSTTSDPTTTTTTPMPTPSFTITPVRTTRDLHATKTLILTYASSLGIDLSFQSFEEEIACLPGPYSPPHGELFLARSTDKEPSISDSSIHRAQPAETDDIQGQALGTIALRPLSHSSPSELKTAELKRLYVSPVARKLGLGRALAQRALATAKELGYTLILLDTLPDMVAAQRMYEALGFVDVEPYTVNPVEGVRFLGLWL